MNSSPPLQNVDENQVIAARYTRRGLAAAAPPGNPKEEVTKLPLALNRLAGNLPRP